MATIIVTDQAPAAKPVSESMEVRDFWQTLLETPQYNVPVVGFGTTRRLAPGLTEIASPLIVTCVSDEPAVLDVRILRGDFSEAWLVRQLDILPYDMTLVPLNGTMLLTGDRLQVKANGNNLIDVTISATVGQAEEDDIQ